MLSLFYPATVAEVRAAVTEGVSTAAEALRAIEASDAGEFETAAVLFAGVLRDARDERLLFAGFQFHFRRNDFAMAERFVRRRLELAPDPSATRARIFTNLGLIHFFRDELPESEAALNAAIEIDRELGDDAGLARDLGNLAMIPEKRGELNAAEELYLEALAIAERVKASPIIATKLSNLGDIALRRGNSDKARQLWTRALALYTELGNERHRLQCQGQLAALDAPPRD